MLISLTVGKVDAGVAVLLTEDKRLIEFPSILLPQDIASGSIVDITVARNHESEAQSHSTFSTLQDSILKTYGLASPSPPTLRLRNATQTSLVLEWDKLSLQTASFRSLSLYRNGQKAGNIPYLSSTQPGKEPVLSTKISGLAVDTEYTFHLVLRTSAGTYSSPRLSCRTHKMTDLTGITVTPGPLPPPLLQSLTTAVDRIGGKIADTVRIDTTHFVCTEGRGREWDRALEMNIPVVRPEWVEGCEREGRIVGVRGYYLGADPKLRQVGAGVGGRGLPTRDQIARKDSHEVGMKEGASEQKYMASATPEDRSGISSPKPPPTPAKDLPVDPMSKAVGAPLKKEDDDDGGPDDASSSNGEAAYRRAGDHEPNEKDDDDDDDDDDDNGQQEQKRRARQEDESGDMGIPASARADDGQDGSRTPGGADSFSEVQL